MFNCRFAVYAVQLSDFVVCHSKASALNVFVALISASRLFSCLTTLGSLPSLTCKRAASRNSRALANDISGYTPNEMRFSVLR